MIHPSRPISLLALAAAVAAAGCRTAGRAPAAPRPSRADAPSPAAQARADSGRPAYTAADVRFMQGMIAHHAQAIIMARLAPTRAAGADLRILAERIDVAQEDEIAFMQRWLRERRETVPEAHGGHAAMGHGTSSDPLMPGMATADEMARLHAASGAEFDRLFLTLMIRHHEGALTMVEQLFASPGAGQDVNVFRFASDVTADQTTEIDRMRAMLAARTAGGR